MMTRMTAVTAPRERISSGLSTVIRDRSNAATGPSRRDKLLGISPGSPSPSPSPLSAIDLDNELREEDVWGGDENSADDLEEAPQPPPAAARFPLKNSRQWLGWDQSSPSPKEASPLGLSSINRPSVSTAAPVRKSTTSASRMIPHVASFEHHPGKMIQQHQSAPVNIPDWGKILGIDAKRSGKENGGFGADDDDEDPDADEAHGEEWQAGELEDGEEPEPAAAGKRGSASARRKSKVRVPPHELAAREYAKSHTAFSVYEGAGRTLKGMDLRRVRNAVWMQTGFIGG